MTTLKSPLGLYVFPLTIGKTYQKSHLPKGIKQARVGNRRSDIGHAIQNYVEGYGFSMVREFVGHMGRPEVRVLNDGWTAVTVDGSLSARFEHTIAITDHGPEILAKFEG